MSSASAPISMAKQASAMRSQALAAVMPMPRMTSVFLSITSFTRPSVAFMVAARPSALMGKVPVVTS